MGLFVHFSYISFFGFFLLHLSLCIKELSCSFQSESQSSLRSCILFFDLGTEIVSYQTLKITMQYIVDILYLMLPHVYWLIWLAADCRVYQCMWACDQKDLSEKARGYHLIGSWKPHLPLSGYPIKFDNWIWKDISPIFGFETCNVRRTGDTFPFKSGNI